MSGTSPLRNIFANGRVSLSAPCNHAAKGRKGLSSPDRAILARLLHRIKCGLKLTTSSRSDAMTTISFAWL